MRLARPSPCASAFSARAAQSTKRQSCFRLQSISSIVSRPLQMPHEASPFNMVIVVPGAWPLRRAFHFARRAVLVAPSWDREDVSDIWTDSPTRQARATHWPTPGERVLERAPNAAQESQSSCHRRCGSSPRPERNSRPRHCPSGGRGHDAGRL
jgi:hypothetical protein